MSDLDAERLAAAVERGLGTPARIEALRRLAGGASRETWSFDAVAGDGEHLPLVLRRDPPGRSGGAERFPGTGRAAEYALLLAARRAGVPVPQARFALGDGDGLGDGFVMDRVEGETIPRRILRDEPYAGARAVMARQCGEILARVHAIPLSELPALQAPPPREHPARAELDRYRALLDLFGEPHPGLELGLRWLAGNLPPHAEPALVHGDFRLGNFIVSARGIEAVLDWELAHLGDPMEDLGWLCVRAWRFGTAPPVGGFGEREDLFAAYGAAGGRPVDPQTVRFWEAFGTLKWGVICIGQAFAHLTGAHRSVELAVIGRRVCETEHDLLELIA